MPHLELLRADTVNLGFAWSTKIVWTPEEKERIELPTEPAVVGGLREIEAALEWAKRQSAGEEWAGLLFLDNLPVLRVGLTRYYDGKRIEKAWVRLPVESIVTLLRSGENLMVRVGEAGEIVRTRTKRERKLYEDENQERCQRLYELLRNLYKRVPAKRGQKYSARSHIRMAAALCLADAPEAAVDYLAYSIEDLLTALSSSRRSQARSRQA